LNTVDDFLMLDPERRLALGLDIFVLVDTLPELLGVPDIS